MIEPFNDKPDIILPTITMTEPNDPIEIYEGNVELRSKVENYVVEGSVAFNWFPRPCSILSGTITTAEAFKDIHTVEFDCYIDGLPSGKCYIMDTHFNTARPNKIIIKAFISGDVAIGDKSIAVDVVEFSIPNLKYIHGQVVRFANSEGGFGSTMARSVFKYEDVEITIDSTPKCSELNKKIGYLGGYGLTYGGRIKKDKKPITYSEAEDILQAFGVFLSFINGRQTHTLFHRGVHDDGVVWHSYKDYHVKPYKPVNSFFPEIPKSDPNELWGNFYGIWKSGEDDREALRMSVNWYLEANSGSGYLEGSLMMTQTSLELLYNWLLIDMRKLITGSDAAGISASNKIRLLLSQMRIDYSVPATMPDLIDFVEKGAELHDAPEAIVQIRNAIVHAQLEKRKKLNAIDAKVKYQALKLSLWYVEMAILYALEYKGYYNSRVHTASYELTPVPWLHEGKPNPKT